MICNQRKLLYNANRTVKAMALKAIAYTCFLLVLLALPIHISAQRRPVKHLHSDSTATTPLVIADSAAMTVTSSDVYDAERDSIFVNFAASDTIFNKKRYNEWEEREYDFNPDPTRAVWMSALFPGLGQIYNRRYWKLPIILGGYLGLAYATSWNNGMLDDYTKAYRDIMDSDPTTKSYMNLFPSTVREEDIDATWLTNILQSRKNYYRRNRDLCIICMVGVYFVAMVDAYVDASLSHFDVTPDLSLDWAPAIFQDTRGSKPAIGLQWALTF